MKRLLAEIFVRFIGPLHSLFMKALAYGPWGPVHPLIIRVFAGLYKIHVPADRHFKNLGHFFLRDMPFKDSGGSLVSPVECLLIDGPRKLDSLPLTVKGIQYQWKDFKELDLKEFSNGQFWNLYLAPYHYHWVHAACEGINLRAIHIPGKKWPVNKLGRWLCPLLYLENERMTFSWEHPKFGRIYMICVAAMGVSNLHSELGPVRSHEWTHLNVTVQKLQKLLAFRLGSTVLLLVERSNASAKASPMLNVGDAL